ncbi:endolytic transglycosylase MltG [Mycolicibacterium tokaiense]|uniref:Endolytic murein transglycosylase n=1 Tax=Mycolicibacterium tokaiense TaxID=39695 RepID=A0A378T7W9_9MYCO|nr:endolytic transglycosylase MltG [Mycolicibacterium tokaiense]BBY88569.1 aminodeoxychorismate lyase [Mycolicibacterium tokaiense]STZ56908.1 secreted solute-binding protein,aminodeoxychorismate lyase-like protein [Mycolicibacterium tokaiense]
MADDWDDRAQPVAVGPPRRGMTRAARIRAERARRRRRTVAALSVAMLIAVVIGTVFLGSRLWHSMFGAPSDYTGDGVSDVVIQVHPGDSATAIGQTLLDAGVVATLDGFVTAASNNSAMAAIQPGFYKVRTEIPAGSAVDRLIDPANRVGNFTIPEGRQLDDMTDVRTGAVTPGVLSLIAQATCTDLDGQQSCVSVDDLRNAASGDNLEALQVPQWAIEPATAMGGDHRRLEGLIAAGTWDVDPSAPPEQILASLISASSARYEASGLLDTAAAMNISPYDVLVVGSLVQRESLPQDFPKVARVIYNRLAENRKLEFDSTVNYSLDRQEIATTDADRARVTPWNTYASFGLPATPISSPSEAALAAAERPEPGDWLFFVTIDMQGTTLFTREYEQHLANIQVAQRNGVLDSAR